MLAVALGAWWRSSPSAAPAPTAAGEASALVDARALTTARRLVAAARTAAEQALAQRAVEAADHVLDLNYAAALREIAENPPPETPEILAAQSRVEAAAEQLVVDNDRLKALRDALEVTPENERDVLAAELAIAEAEYEVRQYQFAAASRALTEAGGNPAARVEALVDQHKAAGTATTPSAQSEPSDPTGLIALVARAWELRGKGMALDAARAEALDAQRALEQQRATLSSKFVEDSTGATASERLASARERAARRRQASSLDERAAANGDVAAVYEEWRELTGQDARGVLRRILWAVALIAGILLFVMLLGRAIAAGLTRLQLDRRQSEALRTVVTVALQVVGVLLIVFVLVGPPTQLATVIGLATAGLTVALKDFIVAFFGWFVLMGRNGIRVGDWVEIRGVAGEVVELSVFHTVLLETGNWADTGHPTGRRVTFTNSYAIEGHYFNFSTSGQWLWDTLEVVVPNGGDLYGFVAAITAKATELTQASARQAEAEWQRAARTRKLNTLSAEPAVRLKPVVGGTEVSVRYIARADERYRLRSDLYAAAVERLGGNAAVA